VPACITTAPCSVAGTSSNLQCAKPRAAGGAYGDSSWPFRAAGFVATAQDLSDAERRHIWRLFFAGLPAADVGRRALGSWLREDFVSSGVHEGVAGSRLLDLPMLLGRLALLIMAAIGR
jgi:hypothetical protein